MKFIFLLLGLLSLIRLTYAETITIATVNNNDNIIMQKMSPEWEKKTGHKINWVILEENILRQRITADIATKSGQFDVITISNYETPIFAKQGWLKSLNDLGEDYDYEDLIKSIKDSLSFNNKLYSLPFYGESTFTMYRKDLFDKAGLKMPDNPTYSQIKEFAIKLTDKSKEQYGLCLRGKPGWGENMAYFSTLVNTFGGRYFDENWKPQINSKEWQEALKFYVDLMKEAGPPGITSNGFNETQALFATGRCAMWTDATSAAGRLFNPKESQVFDKIAFSKMPIHVTSNGSSHLWSWSLAIPETSKKQQVAKDFIKWATSKDYIKLVGEKEGWVAAPPGTRKSTYANENYSKIPFASFTLQAIESADPNNPTKNKVPYTGIQFVAIPEFQAIGTILGQSISSVMSGKQTVEKALNDAQKQVEQIMIKAKYYKK